MRIATWNVNSAKQRLPRLLPWLDERSPDVVCLQETKLADAALLDLLGDELADRGYEVAVHGEASWNGVAIFSRVGLEDVVAGLAGGPGFPHPEARALAATCGGIRVHSVYVPNGREPGSEHYEYKLAWLAALRDAVAAGPEAALVCGDVNIAPTDEDVFDPAAYAGETHVTAPERAALAELQALGLRDVVRDRWPDERVFTYWDYRAGMFHRDLGMRIDLVLAAAPVAARVRAAWVDRLARKGKGPSDHAPVIVDLDEAADGDIGPVVPPPSAPVTKRGAARLPQSPCEPIALASVGRDVRGQGSLGRGGDGVAGERRTRLWFGCELDFNCRRPRRPCHRGGPPARRRAGGANLKGHRRQTHGALARTFSRPPIERRPRLPDAGRTKAPDWPLHRSPGARLHQGHRPPACADRQSHQRLPTLGRDAARRQARALLGATPSPASGALRSGRPLPRARSPSRDGQRR